MHKRKAINKWVLGDAEAPPNFWHLYLKDVAHTLQYANFVLQSKNAEDEATTGVCKPCYRM